MPDLTVNDLKTFVGTRDYAKSRAFYAALGCTVNFDDGSLAELQLGDHRFYLQNYYQKDWCENSMLFVAVASAADWHDHVAQVIASGDFEGTRVAPPKQEDYGALVTYVWDPAGVLLHLAEWQR